MSELEKKSRWFYLIIAAAIVLLGGGLRLYALGQTPRLQRDTITYVHDARTMQTNPALLKKKLRLRQLFYTWLLHYFPEKRVEDAAISFSMVLGMLEIAVIGLLAYELSGLPAAALASALFAAVSPTLMQVSLSGLREPGMLFFCTLGLWLSLRAVRRNEVWMEIVAGVALALGAMFRVEGLELLLIAAIYLAYACYRREWNWKTLGKHCAGMSIGLVAVGIFFGGLVKCYAALIA